MEPREWVVALEREPRVPPGRGERFAGYGVMSAPFRSGHVLAMRRFPASSLGRGYSSVWHYSPVAGWTFWTDGDPDLACPRYFGKALAETRVAPITLTWPGPRRFTVDVGEGELRWTVELGATAVTQLLNRMSRVLPEAFWRNERLLAGLEDFAGSMLQAGHLRLHGRAPNGQHFMVSHLQVWTLEASSAISNGGDLGLLEPIPGQLRLGDFWIPKTPLFAIGRAEFEWGPTPRVLPGRRVPGRLPVPV